MRLLKRITMTSPSNIKGTIHIMKINSIFKIISLWILSNIHTLFCLIGITLVSIGLFTIGAPVGFIGTGAILVALAIYIDRTSN